MQWFWLMLVKPLAAVVLWGMALGLARLLMRLIPEGRLKRLLTRPIGVRGKAAVRRW